MKYSQSSTRALLAAPAFLVVAALGASASDDPANGCPITLSINSPALLAEEFIELKATGTAGLLLCLFIDIDPGPTTIPGIGTFGIGGTPYFTNIDTTIPPSGELTLSTALPCNSPLLGNTFFIQGLVINPVNLGLCITNQVFFKVDPLPGGCPPPCTGQIGNYVFKDLNGNGIQNPGEPGIPGVELTLLDGVGNPAGTTTTDSTGFYSFNGLCAGEYTVVVNGDDVPPGLAPTLCNVGSDKATDSSCASERAVLTTDNSTDQTLDFGYGDCGTCAGKVNALSLSYNGPSTANIQVRQKDGVTVFTGPVEPGVPFTFFGKKSTDLHLDTEISVFVNGALNVKIHTSCSQPIAPGFVFGAFTVLAGSSVDGGLLCADLGCEVGKPEALVFEYTGLSCAASNNPQDGKATCSGNPNLAPVVQIVFSNESGSEVYFNGTVSLGECFEASSKLAGKATFPSNSFAKIYSPTGTLLQSLAIHTSCSQPIGAGDQYGALLLKEFVPEGFGGGGTPTGTDCTAGKPASLTFRYTGQSCAASNNPQDGKALCSGDPAFAPSVNIEFSDGGSLVYFSGTVALDSTFVVAPASIGQSSFKANSYVKIYSLSGTLLQSLAIHTSCSQPLGVGDQYGALLLTVFTPQ
jgi:SdrD B-like domain